MEKGKRLLHEKLVMRSACSISTIPAGKIIEVTQIDLKNKNVLVCDEWVKMDLIERISTEVEEGDDNKL